jgi:hypothetical protein
MKSSQISKAEKERSRKQKLHGKRYLPIRCLFGEAGAPRLLP